ncbi:gluconokinase [Alkalicoccus daliensis]|uniref:Gluconokinase n=1 Tax=Alkalicoccus daliensis TaxID=745820 RepID=A0A1H0EWW3_9BACI|nr:gluconokinase [Alkalicoccus daliensis]SDN86870.1 gluconokinase [Alkalicoccus daliensis]
MEACSIGLDIGTTSAKAVLFTHTGECVDEAEEGYDLIHSFRGCSEQDPYEIEKAALKALSRLDTKKYHVVSAGFSAAMHTLICIDEEGEALSNSISWADTRSTLETEELLNSGQAGAIYQRTGTPVHTMSPLTKLFWLKKNEPKLYEESAAFVSVKEFLLRRWFGAEVVDYSIASATGMFNIHTKTWDAELLEMLEIGEGRLSKAVAPTYILPELGPDIRVKAGLPEGVVFAAGGSDGALANIGIGALQPGETALTIGTSGAVRQITSRPALGDNQQTFCYAFDEGMWVVGGPTNNGGIALQWLQKAMKEKDLETLLQEAADVPVDVHNPIFLPYLQGERAPIWDPGAKGSFVQLSIEHEQKHFTRAVLEGVIFSVCEVFEHLETIVEDGEKALYASGGFSRSPLWLQITADIFGSELSLPVSYQSSAWGAAWCSMMAAGITSSYEDITSSIPMKEKIVFDTEAYQTYREIFSRYKKIYEALKTIEA